MDLDFAHNPEFLSAVFSIKSSELASLAFLLFDYVLTFDDEIEYIWNRSWSFGKWLFILSRYFAISVLFFNAMVLFKDSVSPEFCLDFGLWEGVGEYAAIVVVDVVQVARIYAVYHRNKKLLAILVVLVIAEVVSTILILLLSQPGRAQIPIEGVTGCWATGRTKFFFLDWLPGLLFEVVACTMVIYKARKTYMDQNGSALLNVILRDSLLYFVIIFLGQLINLIIWASPSQFLAQVALGWAVALPGAFGSRILLNMRKEYFKRDETLDSEVLSSVNPVWQSGMELQSVKRNGPAPGMSFFTMSRDSDSLGVNSTFQRTL